jgi:hypothetical protein
MNCCARAADKTLKYKEMKEEVVEYLHSRGVSQSLVSNVLRFYDMRYPNKVYFEEDRILNGLPNGLIDRIKLQCYSDVLASTGKPCTLHPAIFTLSPEPSAANPTPWMSVTHFWSFSGRFSEFEGG